MGDYYLTKFKLHLIVMKLYQNEKGLVKLIKSIPFKLEKEIQTIIETNTASKEK